MLTTPTGAALRQARNQLIELGEVPPATLVGPTVARSWRRCLDAIPAVWFFSPTIVAWCCIPWGTVIFSGVPNVWH